MSAIRSVSERLGSIGPSTGGGPEPDAFRCRNCGRDAGSDAERCPNCDSENLRPLFL